MKIRKATKKDIRKISELYYSEMQQKSREVDEEPISKEKYEKILENNFDNSEMYVLEEEDIKGFIWYKKENHEYNLEDIFVLEKGKGHGKKLVNYLLSQARKNNIQKINLDVHFKNKNAQKFFKKFGFTERTIEMSLDL